MNDFEAHPWTLWLRSHPWLSRLTLPLYARNAARCLGLWALVVVLQGLAEASGLVFLRWLVFALLAALVGWVALLVLALLVGLAGRTFSNTGGRSNSARQGISLLPHVPDLLFFLWAGALLGGHATGSLHRLALLGWGLFLLAGAVAAIRNLMRHRQSS